MTIATIDEYESLIYGLPSAYTSILVSTLRVVRDSPYSGQTIGEIFFPNDIRLVVAELIDFDLGYLDILQYGYTV